MSIPVRCFALAITLGAITLAMAPLTADDKDARAAKIKECTFKSDYYGASVLKPDKKEWKFLTQLEWSGRFQGGGDDVAFFLAHFDSADADPKTDNANISIYCLDIGKDYFDSMGKKGLAKAIQEYWLEKQYKNIKNLKEATSTKQYRFSKGKSVTHFEFDGESQKYGGAIHTLCICFKFSKFGFLILMDCAPGDQKKFAKEIQSVWDNMVFTEKDK